MKSGSIFHPFSWISHNYKRPVKIVPASEILATSKGNDESKMIFYPYMELMNVKVRVHMCMDSKDLCTSSYTQRKCIDHSIPSDVACLRQEFQVGNLAETSWRTGILNKRRYAHRTRHPSFGHAPVDFVYWRTSGGLQRRV